MGPIKFTIKISLQINLKVLSKSQHGNILAELNVTLLEIGM